MCRHTVGAKKTLRCVLVVRTFFFLRVTVGGAFPIFFLSVLRKRTVLQKRTTLSD